MQTELAKQSGSSGNRDRVLGGKNADIFALCQQLLRNTFIYRVSHKGKHATMLDKTYASVAAFRSSKHLKSLHSTTITTELINH